MMILEGTQLHLGFAGYLVVGEMEYLIPRSDRCRLHLQQTGMMLGYCFEAESGESLVYGSKNILRTHADSVIKWYF